MYDVSLEPEVYIMYDVFLCSVAEAQYSDHGLLHSDLVQFLLITYRRKFK